MHYVEKAQIVEHFDYPLHLYALNRIGFDEACALTSLGTDLISYNTVIGRGINLRWSDWSGLNFNTSGFSYIKRLFRQDGDSVLSASSEQSAFLLMPHYLLPAFDVLQASLSTRLKYILVLRHPLLVFTHWHSYLQRFLSPREFTLSVSYNGSKIPWFCATHLSGCLEAEASIPRTVLLLTSAYNNLLEQLDGRVEYLSSKMPQNILVLTFDQICYESFTVLSSLSQFLGRDYKPILHKVLRREKLPRVSQAQGRGFASYGFNPDSNISDAEQKSNVLSMINASTNSDLYNQFLSMQSRYERISAQLVLNSATE
jgi:hypothetical protein